MLKTVRLVSLAVALAAVAGAALAQTYPTKPIKIVVSTSPGGITDILARFLGDHITAKTGQTVIIDNRAGGSAISRWPRCRAPRPTATRSASPTPATSPSIPILFQKLNYDPLNDLVPVGPVGTVPLFLVTNAERSRRKAFGVHRLRQGQSRQGQLCRCGRRHDARPRLERVRPARRARTRGGAAPRHRTRNAGRDRRRRAGHVRVDGAAYRVRAKGVLRVLAAATPKRPPHVPDVPTFAEQGFPGFEAETWFALFAPRARRRRSSTSSTTTPAACRPIRNREADCGDLVDPLPQTQDEFAAQVKADAVKWERIVRESGVKLE